MAKCSGLNLSVLAKYEQGKILDLNPWILEKIAKSLKISPIELLPLNDQNKIKNLYDYFCPVSTPGKKIKNLRLRHRLQQKDLAKMLDVNRETIRRYEKDQSKPDKNIISKIENILHIKFQ